MRLKYDLIAPLTLWLVLLFTMTACSSLGVPSEKNKQLADTHLQLGSRYLSMNKLEIAKENLLQAVSEDPTNAQAHNALAFLYEKIKLPSEAEDEYEKAHNQAPDDYGIQNNYGRFLCERGETEKGMAMLSAASSNPLNDRSWMALTNAGRCSVIIGDKQKAENYFRQALEIKKNYAPALSSMQKISYEKGDLWAAKGFLERYASVAAHTPETLFIAAQTERGLGNLASAKDYRNKLLEKFPLSNEATKIRSVLP